MKRLLRWAQWELENEFHTCGYFVVMLSCYGITEWIYGKREFQIIYALEMYLLNYLICFVQKLLLDEEKDYSKEVFHRRSIGLTIYSGAMVVVGCRGFGWFADRSIYAELFMYICMLSAYAFVWLMRVLVQKADTKQLNEQLAQYKEKEEIEGKRREE